MFNFSFSFITYYFRWHTYSNGIIRNILRYNRSSTNKDIIPYNHIAYDFCPCCKNTIITYLRNIIIFIPPIVTP